MFGVWAAPGAPKTIHRFGPLWDPIRPQIVQTTPAGRRTTSDCIHMSCSHIQRSPSYRVRQPSDPAQELCELATVLWHQGLVQEMNTTWTLNLDHMLARSASSFEPDSLQMRADVMREGREH